jgi:hypothetical protein
MRDISDKQTEKTLFFSIMNHNYTKLNPNK